MFLFDRLRGPWRRTSMFLCLGAALVEELERTWAI
jgi:hypothetical protein